MSIFIILYYMYFVELKRGGLLLILYVKQNRYLFHAICEHICLIFIHNSIPFCLHVIAACR